MDKIAANKKSKPLSLFLIILLLLVFLSSCAKVSDTDAPASADDGDDENDPCGNALENGDEIISGPSGPSGADHDSVFRSLTVDPTNPRIVIIGTERNGFVMSTDGGESWERITVEANERYNDYLIIRMANTDPNTLITFGFNYDDLNLNLGFLKSTDNGSSWIQFAPDLKGLLISYFDISSDASVIYAVSRDEWKILKSADGGNTWIEFPFHMSCYALAVSPSDAERVLFSIMDKLYLSTDGMQSYTMVIDNIGSTFDDIVFASSNNNIVYAVTKGYLLYKSEDGGVTFSLVKNIRSDVLNVIS